MTNNRLWLYHIPTKKSVLLGARAGLGWDGEPIDLYKFFNECGEADNWDTYGQDDFCLLAEMGEGRGIITDGWVYAPDRHPLKPVIEEEIG
jgi:hypothetical protein